MARRLEYVCIIQLSLDLVLHRRLLNATALLATQMFSQVWAWLNSQASYGGKSLILPHEKLIGTKDWQKYEFFCFFVCEENKQSGEMVGRESSWDQQYNLVGYMHGKYTTNFFLHSFKLNEDIVHSVIQHHERALGTSYCWP